MTKLLHAFAIIAILVGAQSIARADVPACPVPDGPGNEGNEGAPMSCWDFTQFATQLGTCEANFRAAGGVPGAVAVGTSYGTMTSRSEIIADIVGLLTPNTFRMNRAQVRAKWAALFAINNPAYLSRLGAANTAANGRLIAAAWLPINQASLDGAVTARNAALAAWQANQTPANSQIYWNAERRVVLYEEMVGATRDAMM